MKLIADLLHSYFEEAASEAGIFCHMISLAGGRVEFRCAGDRWTPLMRSFTNLEPNTGGEPLTVFVWDGEHQPKNHVLRAYLFALTNWWFDYVGPRGRLLDVDSPRLSAIYVPGPDLLQVVDVDRNVAYCWKREATPLPYWETCSPFRALLHCWLRSRGVQFVHASAVGTPAGGVLLVGRGGSGKSSSALACLGSPLRYLSDDYCIVSRDGSDGGYTAHSLYSTAKLTGAEDFERFPALAPYVWNIDREPGEKAAFFIQEQAPEKFIGAFPLRAILVPQVTGERDTEIDGCPTAEVMQAVAPWTLAQLPASGSDDLRFLGELVRCVPAWRLKLGTDVTQIPTVIQGLLDSGPSSEERQ